MIGDIYVCRAGEAVHYCRILEDMPRSVKAVEVRGTPLPGDKLDYGNGYPRPDARRVTKPFYLFKRDGCLVRGLWRFVLVTRPGS
jgi:hypothetical protein